MPLDYFVGSFKKFSIIETVDYLREFITAAAENLRGQEQGETFALVPQTSIKLVYICIKMRINF